MSTNIYVLAKRFDFDTALGMIPPALNMITNQGKIILVSGELCVTNSGSQVFYNDTLGIGSGEAFYGYAWPTTSGFNFSHGTTTINKVNSGCYFATGALIPTLFSR